MTSVARLMASTSDSRQPYRLSNFDLVTESLTLMAGNASSPFLCMSYRRCTPVVVSSVTPLICLRRVEYHFGCFFSVALYRKRTRLNSSHLGISYSFLGS